MTGSGDRVVEVLFVIESIRKDGDTAYSVRSPNMPGLGVIAPTLKQAYDEAIEVAGRIRRSHGQTGPFNVQLEVR